MVALSSVATRTTRSVRMFPSALVRAEAWPSGESLKVGVESESLEARWEALFRRFGPIIYHRCRTLLGENAAAQDATQETFLRVRRRLEQVPDIDQSLSYIYRVATNYCLNERRDQRLRPQPVADLLDRSEASFEDHVSNRHLVARLIARMPAHLRAPAFLHFVDGLDQGEVAHVLHVSRRTVVSRLSEFLSRARRLLEESPS
jgi:RNA polymerase sigma-70 factor (ECF subfamily)